MTALHDAWTAALPAVLRLTQGHRRDMFRRELQSFLAFCSMDPEGAKERVAPLSALLLEAARAARVPAAIATTRSWEPDLPSMSALCHHLLAGWRDAEEAAKSEPTHDPSGMTGDVFFGPRLGGPGRPGALTRTDLPGPSAEDDGPDEGA